MNKVSKNKSNAGLIYGFSFGIPVIISMVILIIEGVYPFGERSFLFSDMYHQYMPFFTEFYEKIKGGEGLGYTFNVGIGSNFLALYVYYLASPLHWLAFLFPKEHIMEFMTYLAITKIGLAGLTASICFRKHYKTDHSICMLAAVFYALSGFMAAYNWNIMWLDCVVLFPLIILGLERLMHEGKPVLYCITLALSIYTNYYISIMICMFLVLYFGVSLLWTKKKWPAIGRFALYSLLAGAMAAVLLIPEVAAILQTDFGEASFPKKYESYYPILDVLSRHCLAVSCERGLDHWPNIYCGVAVFLLAPLYAINEKIPARRRFGMLFLAGLMLYSFSANVPDFIWHGLNFPDSLPGRQSFLYIFILLFICVDAVLNLQKIPEKSIIHCYLGAAAFLLFSEKFATGEEYKTGIQLVTLLFVTAYGVILYIYRRRTNKKVRMILLAAGVVLIITESAINTANTTFGTTSRTDYLGKLGDYQSLVAKAQDREDTFFRFEKFQKSTKNDGTLAGFPTASVFSSTMNSDVALYKRLGMRHSKVFYCFEGSTPFVQALFNVNYTFGDDECYENELYSKVDQSGDIILYENAMRLPLGYVAPLHYDLPDGYKNSPVELQNRMINDLGVSGSLLEPTSFKKDGDDLVITAGKNGIYYAMINNSSTKKVKISGGELDGKNFKDLKIAGLLYLGYLESGETVRLVNGDTSDDTPAVSAEGYRLNEEVCSEALDLLKAQHMEVKTFDAKKIEGSISMTKAGRVILSVPAEKGWKISVNGQETECEKFGGALMAFDLEPGDYTISMHYVPEGSKAGKLVSIAGILVFALITYLKKPRNWKVKKEKAESGKSEKQSEKA